MRQSIESVFHSYDNTSASTLKILGFKKGKKKLVGLGDVVLVIPKKFYISKDIQKKKKYLGIVIGLKKNVKRKNGLVVSSLDNKLLTFNFQFKFLGTRVYGGLCKETRGGAKETLLKKVISYSNGTY